MSKHFGRSKTLWANALILAVAWWARTSAVYVDPLWFIGAIVAANMGLRVITTHRLSWRRDRSDWT